MSFVTGETALLDLRLFGEPSVFVRGADITRSLPKKAVILIAMLALRGGKPIDREYVASVLWPDVSESTALHNLRQMLAGIRRLLGDAKDVLESPTPRTLCIKPSPGVRVDALEFDFLCASRVTADLEAAVRIYVEPLLPSCDEAFAIEGRGLRQQVFLKSAETLADRYVQAKDFAAAITTLRRILIEDPHRESACRALMTSLVAGGQLPAALELYRVFRRKLREDLLIDVSAETKNLYREIRKSSTTGLRTTKQRAVPNPVGELIGREEEIAHVVGLLKLCRLTSLTGPGGVGKTRLSLAVADRVNDSYLDGACFVDLAPVQSAETIPMAIASALDIREVMGKSMMEAITEFVSAREMLIVFDNCEHILRDVAKVIDELLQTASALHVLATSRQNLGLRGEAVWNVPSLKTAPGSDDAEDLMQIEAVRLFLHRTRRPIDKGNLKDLSAVASICRRLDGLPLAIELAAARTNLFSAAEIDRRLDDRFALLANAGQSVARHQTLQACMDWSWEMLSSSERSLLISLSVFRGGCTLNAIRQVANEGIGDIDDLLASLIDKSLVTVGGGDDATRYHLLETVREYSEQKMIDVGDEVRPHERHRNYFLAWVEEGYRPMDSVEEKQKFADYEAEHDNLRTAISWCHHNEEHSKAIRMCAALSRFWDTCGHLNEGRVQLEFALSQKAPDLTEETLGRALVHVAWMATVQGECDAAVGHYKTALKIAEKRGDKHAIGVIYNCMANAYISSGDVEGARDSLLKSLAVAREIGQSKGVAMILANLAEVALNRDDLHDAMYCLDEAKSELGEFSSQNSTTSGTILRNLSFLRFRSADFTGARLHAYQSLKFYNDAGIIFEIPFALMTLAFTEGGLGRWMEAVTLYSACETALKKDDTKCPPYIERSKSEGLRAAAEHLSTRDFKNAWETGSAMSIASAVEFAMQIESCIEGNTNVPV